MLTVNNTSTSTQRNPLFEPAALRLEWQLYNAAGAYNYTTTNAAGCDSIATLVPTVANATSSTTSVTRCSNQLPLRLEWHPLQRERTYVYQTTNAAGCDSTATLILTVSTTVTSTTTVTRCPNQLPL